jgi:hypothetical protein
MKAYGGVGVTDPHFLDLGSRWRWVVSFTPRPLSPGAHWIGGWVDPRAGLDDLENRRLLTLPGVELRPLSRPARLRHHGSLQVWILRNQRFISWNQLLVWWGHLPGWNAVQTNVSDERTASILWVDEYAKKDTSWKKTDNWNVSGILPDYTVFHPKSSQLLAWEPRIKKTYLIWASC